MTEMLEAEGRLVWVVLLERQQANFSADVHKFSTFVAGS